MSFKGKQNFKHKNTKILTQNRHRPNQQNLISTFLNIVKETETLENLLFTQLAG